MRARVDTSRVWSRAGFARRPLPQWSPPEKQALGQGRGRQRRNARPLAERPGVGPIRYPDL